MAAILDGPFLIPKVKSDFSPHLKIKLMTYTKVGRNFMLFSENAQF